jgi:hypothetical protein
MVTWGAVASRQISSRGVVEQPLLVIPFHDLARIRLQLLLLLVCAVQLPAVAAACLMTAVQRERSPYPFTKARDRGRDSLVAGCANPEDAAPG